MSIRTRLRYLVSVYEWDSAGILLQIGIVSHELEAMFGQQIKPVRDFNSGEGGIIHQPSTERHYYASDVIYENLIRYRDTRIHTCIVHCQGIP